MRLCLISLESEGERDRALIRSEQLRAVSSRYGLQGVTDVEERAMRFIEGAVGGGPRVRRR